MSLDESIDVPPMERLELKSELYTLLRPLCRNRTGHSTRFEDVSIHDVIDLIIEWDVARRG